MKGLVFCVCASQDQADEMISQLKDIGFLSQNISALTLDLSSVPDPGIAERDRAVLDRSLPTERVSVRGLGELVSAGPILKSLKENHQDGLIAACTAMGLPYYESELYDRKVREGNALIGVEVRSSDQMFRVKTIFVDGETTEISSTRLASPKLKPIKTGKKVAA